MRTVTSGREYIYTRNDTYSNKPKTKQHWGRCLLYHSNIKYRTRYTYKHQFPGSRPGGALMRKARVMRLRPERSARSRAHANKGARECARRKRKHGEHGKGHTTSNSVRPSHTCRPPANGTGKRGNGPRKHKRRGGGGRGGQPRPVPPAPQPDEQLIFATWNLDGAYGFVSRPKARLNARDRQRNIGAYLRQLASDGCAPHIVAVQETWLARGEHPPAVRGYRWLHKPREAKSTGLANLGGGVGFLVSNCIRPEDVHVEDMANHEHAHSSMWVRVRGPAGGILLGSVYGDLPRHLVGIGTNTKEVWASHAAYLSERTTTAEVAIMAGDLNAHMGNWQEDSTRPRRLPGHQPAVNGNGHGLKSLLQEEGMVVVNGREGNPNEDAEPTRYPKGGTNHPTQLDLMVTAPTTARQRLSDFRVHKQDARISDHCMVSVNISIPREHFPKPPLQSTPSPSGTATPILHINYRKLRHASVAAEAAAALNSAILQWGDSGLDAGNKQRSYTDLSDRIGKSLVQVLGETARKPGGQKHPRKSAKQRIVTKPRHRAGARPKRRRAEKTRRRRENHARARKHCTEKNFDAQLLADIDEATARGDQQATYKAVRRLMSRGSEAPRKPMPIRGLDGQIQYEEHLIAEAHQEFWKGVGRYRPPATDATRADAKAVADDTAAAPSFTTCCREDIYDQHGAVRPGTTKDAFRDYINSKITARDVGKALMKAAAASAPGNDRVSFRALKLINEQSGEILAQLYNQCILQQWAPVEWLSATVKALFKLKATSTTEASLNPANYRGISLLSCIGKTIERVIDTRMREYLQHFDIADGAQGGFKANWGTPMQTLTLEEALLAAGEDTPACFIDTRKAFPSVRRESAFIALGDLVGTRGPLWQYITQLYDGVQSTFTVGGAKAGSPYSVHTGLREGAILSPLLYSSLMDKLLRKLRNSGFGISVNGIWCGAIAYADDLVLIGLPRKQDPSGAHLQGMLDICSEFAATYMMQYGYSKTATVVFQRGRVAWAPTFTMQNMGGAPQGTADPDTIQLADGYKYLGIWMNHDLTFNKHVEKVVMPSLRDSLRSLRATVATIDVLSPTTAMAIVRTLAEPRATYGSEIWARIDTGDAPRSLCRVTQASMLGIEKEFRLTFRKILGVRSGTATLPVYRELGWLGLRHLYMARKLAAFRNILNMRAGDRPKQVLLARLAETSRCLQQTGHPHDHRSIAKPAPKSSHFAADIIATYAELGMSSTLRQELDTQQPMTDKEYLVMKTVTLPTAQQTHLIQEFHHSGNHPHSAFYDPRQQWTMMPDLADIKNSESRMDKMLISHYRTGAHMLGDQATEWLRRMKVRILSENCPSCKGPVRDDVPHALLECATHLQTRDKYLPMMHGLMRSVHPQWSDMWDSTGGRDGRFQRAIMLLQSANMAEEPTRRAEISATLGQWLKALTDAHPTYSRFNASRGTAVHDYYAVPGV